MTEETPLTCTRFKAGEKIPPWLLDIEPVSPEAIKGDLTWGCEVDVIDVGDYYMVVPLAFGHIEAPIQFNGNMCKLFAAAKVVRVTAAITALFPPEANHWDTDAERNSMGVLRFQPVTLFDAHVPPQGFASGQAQQAMNQPAMQQLKHLNDERLALRKSLWKRIKAVFRP